MSAIKEKGLGYWLSIIVALLAIVTVFAKSSVRLNDVERETDKMKGVEWDIRVVKSVMAKLYPAIYDSVVSNEVRVNGQRPKGE